MPHYGPDLKFIEVNRNIPLGFNEYSIGPMCEAESTRESISVVDRNPAWVILFFILGKLTHCLSHWANHPAFFSCRCINPALTASISTKVCPLPASMGPSCSCPASHTWSPQVSLTCLGLGLQEHQSLSVLWLENVFESTVHTTDGTGLSSLGQLPKDAGESSSILLAGITVSHWRTITLTAT